MDCTGLWTEIWTDAQGNDDHFQEISRLWKEGTVLQQARLVVTSSLVRTFPALQGTRLNHKLKELAWRLLVSM